jgi:hypothetical protein
MAKPTKFSGTKPKPKKKGVDTSFDFGWNVVPKKRRRGKGGGS